MVTRETRPRDVLDTGTVFAGHRIEGVIGRGGMGIVYRARQPSPGRQVALKVVAPELAGDPAIRSRFLAETELLAAVEHPHVVPIHAAGEWDGRLYLTMRLLEGPSLQRLVATEGRLEPARALELLGPIASALDAIHGAGLIHGDVSPTNILLDARGEPYLADFGIARRLSAPGEPRATLAYLAPERIRHPEGGTALDSRADLYAFAGTLVFALTGRSPFPGTAGDALLTAHLEADPPRPSVVEPDLPPALDEVVARAMAKEPAARFATAGAIVAATAKALTPRPAPISTTPIPAEVRPPAPVSPVGGRSPTGSRRFGIGTAATLGLVAVLIVTGVAFGVGLVPRIGWPGEPRASAGTGSAARTPRPSATSRPTPSPTTRPTATPKPTPKPTAKPRSGKPADLAKLRSWLPGDLGERCRSVPLQDGVVTAAAELPSTRGIAAVSCTLDGVLSTTVRYVLYRSEASLRAEWDATIGKRTKGAKGPCASGKAYGGTWRDAGFLGIVPERKGRIACWLGADGAARLDWTVTGTPVRATLRRDDADIGAAYRTWSRSDLSPRRPGG